LVGQHATSSAFTISKGSNNTRRASVQVSRSFSRCFTSIIFKMSSAPNSHHDTHEAVGTPPDLEKASTPPPTLGTSNDSAAIFRGADLSRLIELSDNNEADAVPPLKGLSLLDRFLVLWIILAMALGILLGNLVPSTGPALQKGQFIGVSIPIGELPIIPRWLINR
jgi:hypothetical protein